MKNVRIWIRDLVENIPDTAILDGGYCTVYFTFPYTVKFRYLLCISLQEPVVEGEKKSRKSDSKAKKTKKGKNKKSTVLLPPQ
jgi:hypothetical protein